MHKRWTENEVKILKEHISSGKTYLETSIALKRTKKAIKEKTNKLQLNYAPKIKETISCLNCNKNFQCLISENRKFCTQSCGAIYNNKSKIIFYTCLHCLKKFRHNNGKNKYCSKACSFKHKVVLTERKVEQGNANEYATRTYLIRRYSACFMCKNTDWQGRPIPLELDHIDGNYKNNKLTNVRLLCPNCHALTPTYKAKNKGRGRHKRLKRYRTGQSY